jgi:hypothetical protein
MPLSTRLYIFEDGGPIKRVPRRIRDNLVFGLDAIPAYAGTRQRVAEIMLENENGKSTRILDARGFYWTFDDSGKIDESLRWGAYEAMETWDAAQRASRAKVVDLRPQLKRKEWEQRNRWGLTKDELDRVCADIWPTLARAEAEAIETVKGKAPKRPPLTHEAERLIRDVGIKLFEIGHDIEELSEPALKGFAFEARRHASTDGERAALWMSLATQADQIREVKALRRTGKGPWIAMLQIWRDVGDRTLREIETVEERCDGKSAAVDAGRRLLAKHAHKFSDDVTIEVELYPELEWRLKSGPEEERSEPEEMGIGAPMTGDREQLSTTAEAAPDSG